VRGLTLHRLRELTLTAVEQILGDFRGPKIAIAGSALMRREDENVRCKL
jgi:hypothetical protein